MQLLHCMSRTRLCAQYLGVAYAAATLHEQNKTMRQYLGVAYAAATLHEQNKTMCPVPRCGICSCYIA